MDFFSQFVEIAGHLKRQGIVLHTVLADDSFLFRSEWVDVRVPAPIASFFRFLMTAISGS